LAKSYEHTILKEEGNYIDTTDDFITTLRASELCLKQPVASKYLEEWAATSLKNEPSPIRAFFPQECHLYS
jgi:hypothetical protein